MNKKILCMGSINIDLVMYMEHMPLAGETVVTDNFSAFPGGKGGNQAATAAALGADVSFFTKLGDDGFSKELTTELNSRGVNMSKVMYLPGETAGVAMIRVDVSGQNTISFTNGANGKLTAKDIVEHQELFDEFDILLITMEIPKETVYEAIRVAKSKGLVVILDPAPVPAEGIPIEIAKLVDFVKPNEIETEALTGKKVSTVEDAENSIAYLQKQGFITPIVSLGDRGAVSIVDGSIYFVDKMKVESVDSTAAGDVFLGAFAAELSKGKSIKECLEFAKVSAALSTTKKGAQTSIPKEEEVRKYL